MHAPGQHRFASPTLISQPAEEAEVGSSHGQSSRHTPLFSDWRPLPHTRASNMQTHVIRSLGAEGAARQWSKHIQRPSALLSSVGSLCHSRVTTMQSSPSSTFHPICRACVAGNRKMDRRRRCRKMRWSVTLTVVTVGSFSMPAEINRI